MSKENSDQLINSSAELQQRYAAGERNFRKAKLAAADLKDTDITRADLQSANLKGADLRGADLREANLKGASLKESHLSRANFTAAKLEGANLSGANLELAMLAEADLQAANLRGASLSGTILRKANLEMADLTLADLSDIYMLNQGGGGGANLEGANLRGANLSKANLRGADLRGANLKEVNLDKALTQGAYYDAQTRFPNGFDPVKMGMHKLATSSRKSDNLAQGLKLSNSQRYSLTFLACLAVVLAPVVIVRIWAGGEVNEQKPELTLDEPDVTQTDQSQTQTTPTAAPASVTPTATPASVTPTPRHNSSARKPHYSLSISLLQVPCYGWRARPVLNDSYHFLDQSGHCMMKIRRRKIVQ